MKRSGIGITARAGNGGTLCPYCSLAMWLSPEFQLLIVKEFQRLKDEEKQVKKSWAVGFIEVSTTL